MLAPGGRIVLIGQDWDGFFIDSDHPELTRIIVHARADTVAAPRAARRYRNLLLDTGFIDPQIEVHTGVFTDHTLLPMLTGIAHAASAVGAITSGEAEDWIGDQTRRGQADRDFVAIPLFLAHAGRPELAPHRRSGCGDRGQRCGRSPARMIATSRCTAAGESSPSAAVTACSTYQLSSSAVASSRTSPVSAASVSRSRTNSCKCCWARAIVTYPVVAAATRIGADPDQVRGGYQVMAMLADAVLLPLALASLVTRLICSLGTAWGLLRHYWVLFKLLLNLAATVVWCSTPARSTTPRPSRRSRAGRRPTGICCGTRPTSCMPPPS
ncbi:hypothetical protein HJ581_0042575 [Rhodococcus opacus]|nr:hypothetical protein HJ581_0042575 [Rhodococcus opacus]